MCDEFWRLVLQQLSSSTCTVCQCGALSVLLDSVKVTCDRWHTATVQRAQYYNNKHHPVSLLALKLSPVHPSLDSTQQLTQSQTASLLVV